MAAMILPVQRSGQMLGIFHELDRKQIVQKLKAARQRARAADPDYREGKKPYGMLLGEHETILRMRELRAQGKRLRDICEILEQEGRMPRVSGAHWHPTTIARILGRD